MLKLTATWASHRRKWEEWKKLWPGFKRISLRPDFVEAYLDLCELLEKTNKIDQVARVIRTAIENNVKEQTICTTTLVEFHNGKYEASEKLVNKIDITKVAQKWQPSRVKLQADLYHHKENYSAAFETYKLKNKLVKNSAEFQKQGAEEYLLQQKQTITQLQKLIKETPYVQSQEQMRYSPRFLIGFPRSGTTLLDTILRTRSNIDVLEELPMVAKMIASLQHVATVSGIEKIDDLQQKLPTLLLERI